MSAPPRHAAFFRNLNLGRANCPTRAQLEAAFLEAGAVSPASFQVNGTLVFGAPSAAAAARVAARAARALQQGCGLREPYFLRSLQRVAALAALDPFGGRDLGAVYACCVTFLDERAALPALPLSSPKGDVEVLAFHDAAALSLSRRLGASPGSPNALLERRLGLPATTRKWETILRLLDKHG